MPVILGSLQGHLNYGERAPIFTFASAECSSATELDARAQEELKKIGDFQGVIVEERIENSGNLYTFDMDKSNRCKHYKICDIVSSSLGYEVQPQRLTLLALAHQIHHVGDTFNIGYVSLLEQLEGKNRYSLIGDYALGYKQGPRY